MSNIENIKSRQLSKLAKELNQITGSTIKYVAIKKEDMIPLVNEVIENLNDSQIENISESSLNVIKQLGYDFQPENHETENVDDSEEKNNVDDSEEKNNVDVEEEKNNVDVEEDIDKINDEELHKKSLLKLRPLKEAAKDINNRIIKKGITDFEEINFKKGTVATLKEDILEIVSELSGDECALLTTPTIELLTIGLDFQIPKMEHVKENPRKKRREKSKPEVKKKKSKKENKSVSSVKSKYTRAKALVEALKQGSGTRKDISETSNNIYIDNGGKDNVKVSNELFGYVVPAFIELGVVTISDGIYELVN